MAAMTAVFGFAGDGEAVKAGGTDPVKTISALTGVDVAKAVARKKPARVVLPEAIGPFKEATVFRGSDGMVGQIRCVADYPAAMTTNAIIEEVGKIVPGLCKRIGATVETAEPDRAAHMRWRLKLNGTEEWSAAVYVAEAKNRGKPLGHCMAALTFFHHRQLLPPAEPHPDSERVPIPTEPPKGDIGDGQGEKWVRATFGKDADMILAKGYEKWLMEWVGVMVQNGHYKSMVHVEELPNGPCEISCGPYRVHVTKPGVYSFPLEVLKHYDMKIEPEATVHVDYDDGYRGPGKSFDVVTEPVGRKPVVKQK